MNWYAFQGVFLPFAWMDSGSWDGFWFHHEPDQCAALIKMKECILLEDMCLSVSLIILIQHTFHPHHTLITFHQWIWSKAIRSAKQMSYKKWVCGVNVHPMNNPFWWNSHEQRKAYSSRDRMLHVQSNWSLQQFYSWILDPGLNLNDWL